MGNQINNSVLCLSLKLLNNTSSELNFKKVFLKKENEKLENLYQNIRKIIKHLIIERIIPPKLYIYSCYKRPYYIYIYFVFFNISHTYFFRVCMKIIKSQSVTVKGLNYSCKFYKNLKNKKDWCKYEKILKKMPRI